VSNQLSERNIRNSLLLSKEIAPQEIVVGNGVDSRHRSYIHSSTITELAIDRFRKTGRGITYTDLMDAGVAIHKR
jgi:hypothetical protein